MCAKMRPHFHHLVIQDFKRENLDCAYLAGVIVGDGYCTARVIGLHVKDLDFAQAFAFALANAFDYRSVPKLEGGKYWRVRSSNQYGRYNCLKTWVCTTSNEKAKWLQGFFDSEGNVGLKHSKISENSYARQIAMYNTKIPLLEKAQAFLLELGITSKIRYMPMYNDNHLGTKPLYEIRVLGSKLNYTRFAQLISSNIARKRSLLDAMESSYQLDTDYCKRGQAKGIETKRRKSETLFPQIMEDIREMVKKGLKTTEANCNREIRGYCRMYKRFGHRKTIDMALGGEAYSSN
jgi:hypothetical protein